MLNFEDCDKHDRSVSSTGNSAGAIRDIRFSGATTLRDCPCLRNVLQKYVVSGKED